MNDNGEPLVYSGGDEEPVEHWQGMKPSLCWANKGISEIRGQIRNYLLQKFF